jgi:hypothetical protein
MELDNQEWQELQKIIDSMRKLGEEEKATAGKHIILKNYWEGFCVAVYTFENRVRALHPRNTGHQDPHDLFTSDEIDGFEEAYQAQRKRP